MGVQLDDALEVIDAQNLPGTIDEYPNWRRRLPLDVKDLFSCNSLRAMGEIVKPNR